MGTGLPAVITDRPAMPEVIRAAIPVEYETALKALAACLSLEETRAWRNTADLLATYARIYRSREAEVAAKRLRLHAYRRMGQLAAELRPSGRANVEKGRRGVAGKLPGAASLLMEHGLTIAEARSANFIGRLPDEQFKRILVRPRSPMTVAYHLWGKDPVWMQFIRAGMNLRGILRRHPPHEIQVIAHMLGERQEGSLRVMVADLRRLLRLFDGQS